MKKTTLTVKTPYGIFTRTTGHKYTHVVVVCGYNSALLTAKIAEAEGRYAKRPTAELAQWVESLKSRLTHSLDAHAAKRGQAETWSHSLRNAQAAQRSLERAGLLVVGIYPVPDPLQAEVESATPAPRTRKRTGQDLTDDGYNAAKSGAPCEAPTANELDRAAWEIGWRAAKREMGAALSRISYATDPAANGHLPAAIAVCGLCGESYDAHRPASGNSAPFCMSANSRPGDTFVRAQARPAAKGPVAWSQLAAAPAPAAVATLLEDIKSLWDVAGLGDDPQVSEPIYSRMVAAIAQLREVK